LSVPVSEFFESALFLFPGELRSRFGEFRRCRETEGFGRDGLLEVIGMTEELGNDDMGGDWHLI